MTTAYDVYGAVRGSTGPSGTSHQYVGALGHASDAETGYVYMRARHYDPVTGRFICEDPMGNGSTEYCYAENNPVGRLDRSGGTSLLEEEEALAYGLEVEGGSGGGLAMVYRYLIGRIVQATGAANARLAVEILSDRPVPWSAAEYQFLKDTGTLLIRMSGRIPRGQIAQTFCREVAEFLRINEYGSCMTKDLWQKWGPQLYDDLMNLKLP